MLTQNNPKEMLVISFSSYTVSQRNIFFLFPQLIGLNRTLKNQQGALGFDVTLSIANTSLLTMLTYLK